jgi:hypothetical protein
MGELHREEEASEARIARGPAYGNRSYPTVGRGNAEFNDASAQVSRVGEVGGEKPKAVRALVRA